MRATPAGRPAPDRISPCDGCHATLLLVSVAHWPRGGKPYRGALGSQLGRHFLTEEADGILEAIRGHQAAHVRLHEYSRKTQLMP
jgi:hypothetical protein